jgi:ribosomal protein L12E/L44/L45/RPP1/RPP2
MKELAAYMLLVVGGNEAPSADDVKGLITTAGGEADEEKLTAMMGDLEGKDIHELLEKGETDLKSVVGCAAGELSYSFSLASEVEIQRHIICNVIKHDRDRTECNL